jgi:hypothetical protein
MTPLYALNENKPRNLVVLNDNNPNIRLKGYKVLKDNKNGTYGPGIYNSYNKNIVYMPGQETVETNYPYLFVFPNAATAKSRVSVDRRLFEVSFDPADLKVISRKGGESEIQVTKLRVDQLIEMDSIDGNTSSSFLK